MGMRIVSDSVYQAHKPNRNGPNAKGFFVLNIRGEVDTILNFTFVDDNSQDPVTVPNFVISIYDFDRGCSGQSAGLRNKTCDGGSFDLGEVVMAKSSTADPAQGFDAYITSGGTSEVEIGAVTGGWTSFSATLAGSGADNPGTVQGLTEDQLNKAVSLYYSNTSSFQLRVRLFPPPAFNATLTDTGRNILLSGVDSSLFDKQAPVSDLSYADSTTGRPWAECGQYTSQWWGVDLGSEVYVRYVRLQNRNDCCAERLTGIDIYLGSTAETYTGNALVKSDVSVLSNVMLEVEINALGRYIYLN
ncbi:hypothetical protein EMIHUDRAFT_256322 [Emiliania huxleyi CCMP1516]|uniref:F5/8 type C domain-containing protein n=2 Tax=Emiliania huxleyi TaxID=2903 RepID=A0A0D3IX55_EMIH1|nr:hypothetical protein EMIHUDRAFT_256322 [Emiliania huxleyi CCMP1516]EOD15840.1 hypothetical protein EMIHUDRAFT_256322 [Emiliania huxleyi CCMP1516]|eukprot:XP_005768269.1 hypothetical protein EMIHUDRAFT_256322 [Emiliania huxleyi CCMP1516]